MSNDPLVVGMSRLYVGEVSTQYGCGIIPKSGIEWALCALIVLTTGL